MTLALFNLWFLAQITPDTPDLDVLAQLAQAVGAGKWFVAAPAAVFLVVKALRMFGAKLVPWLGTKVGGIVLALGASTACAFLNVAMTGAPFTWTLALGVAFQVLYAFLGSMGIQSGAKSVAESVVAGQVAAAKVESKADALKVLQK